MFCYMMLADFQKYEVSMMEYVLMGWVGVLILEEVRQVGWPVYCLLLFVYYCVFHAEKCIAELHLNIRKWLAKLGT